MEYTIENNFLKVVLSTYGAELQSVVDKATGAELLWQGNPEVWPRRAPILFPYCGKLKNGKFTHKDIEYSGGQHGFARDMEHILTDKTEQSATLLLEANALTMEKFPFAFKLISTYTLVESTLHHSIEVHNDGDEPMPFGFGYHPGFNCPFDEKHKTEDYVLRFSQPETPTVIDTGTGLVSGKTSVFFEQQTDIPLTDVLFAHDSLCFTNLKSEALSLVEKDSGRRIDVCIAGYPYVLIWSVPGTLQYVCIEPWFGLPDAENASGVWTQKAAALTLAAETSWKTDLAMKFTR